MYRIGFCSTACFRPYDLDILDIIKQGRKKNLELELGGLLYYDGTRFLHILEGQKNRVLEVFNSIQNDRRHHSIINFDPSEFGIQNLYAVGLSVAKTDSHSIWANVISRSLVAGNAHLREPISQHLQ